MTESKKLVAYFSCSGVTARAARALADAIGAELAEIVPAQPYSRADLDWTDARSRSTIESKDPACRPEIARRIDAVSQAATVFVGFPIWWYQEPAIIDTFLEAYDFAGKTVVPFCTSGGSGVAGIDERFRSICATASAFRPAQLVNGMGIAQMKQWVDGLDL